MRQRKLFPSPKNSSCADLCSSTCKHGCYSYSSSYPILPPPPPPPPPPSLSEHNPHLSSIAIIIISLFGSCCLLFALITAKRCCNCNRFRPRQRRTIADTANDHDQFVDENPRRIIDHPIWYINTIGLRPSIIRSITVFSYNRGENLIDVTECSVCLNEFQNGETLRLLPKCNHAFHIECIDTWLRSHINCPVCRSCIVSNVMVPTPLPSNRVNSSTTIVQDSGALAENSERNGELNNVNQTRNEVLCPSGVGTEEVLEFPLVRVDDLDAESANNSGELERVETCKLHDHYLREISILKDGNYDILLPWRRSVSAGNSTAKKCGECFVCPRQEEKKGSGNDQGESSGLQGRTCASPITECLHRKPVRMKRSFSHSGRLILSRQHSTPRRKLPFPL